jgi:hypothetical protein
MHTAVCRNRLQAVLGLASQRQITLREVDGWYGLQIAPAKQILDLAA